MAYIRIRENESFDRALMKFNRIVEKEGRLMEVKEKMYFEKPSAIRRREKNIGYRKQQRAQQENES